jgi:hypothetical protein
MKKKVLFEDTVSMYNRWVSGQAAREFGAIKMKFNDLVGNDKGYRTQSPNDARASNVIPYPIPNTVSILGDLITNTTSAINNFKIALKNPLVREDEKAQKELQLIVNCLNNSLEELKQIFVVIDKNAKDA